MIPIDSYDMMIREIRCRETNLVPTTVGVLLVDYSFNNAKEILQPALKWLNELSGDTINFYLPGYEKVFSEPRERLNYFFEKIIMFFVIKHIKNFSPIFPRISMSIK